ncbi:MAG TPA: hypothetical protein VHL98_16080 [Microvirga sp.]|nr:hypothetical protein [Microvirga sp.]
MGTRTFAAGCRAAAAAGLLLAGLAGEAQAQTAGSRRGDLAVEEGSGRRIEIYDVPSVRPARIRSGTTGRSNRMASRPWWDIYDDPVALRRDQRAAWFLNVPIQGPSGYGAWGRLEGGRSEGSRARGAYASGAARTIRQYPRPYETQRSWSLRGN